MVECYSLLFPEYNVILMAFTLQRIDICPRINEFLANFCMRLPIKFITFAKNKHLTLKTKNKILK